MSNNHSPVCRAIDVGFGYTKFTVGKDTAGGAICRSFPSIAPLRPGKQVGAELMTHNQTVGVEINGSVYEVGPDAMNILATTDSRRLDLQFARTPEYLALARGAMYYMDLPHIHYLAVGLPVSSFESMREEVERLLSGTHRIGTREIFVDKVIVAPQPVGGLYDHGVRSGTIHQLTRETNCLIDPGYFTLDWVITSGTKVLPKRSGSADNAGMAAILRAIAESVAQDFERKHGSPGSITETVLHRIDEASRKGTKFKYGGVEVELRQHLKAGTSKVTAALSKLKAGIGDDFDVDNVLLGGGAFHMYADHVREAFPRHKVTVAEDAGYSNVRGFQIMADRRAAKDAKDALATAGAK